MSLQKTMLTVFVILEINLNFKNYFQIKSAVNISKYS